MRNLVELRFPIYCEEIPETPNINALFPFKAFLNEKRGSPLLHLLSASYRPHLSASLQDKLRHAIRETGGRQLHEAFHQRSVRWEDRLPPDAGQHRPYQSRMMRAAQRR